MEPDCLLCPNAFSCSDVIRMIMMMIVMMMICQRHVVRIFLLLFAFGCKSVNLFSRFFVELRSTRDVGGQSWEFESPCH